MEGHSEGDNKPKPRLTEGHQLRCPGCEKLGHPFRDFKPMVVVEKYQDELFPVYCHVKYRGGCGHVFAPGDPWIIKAYLAGDLVPAERVTLLKQEVENLQARIAELESEKEGSNADERKVAA